MIRGQTVAAIMPALNEAGVIGATLAALPRDLVDCVWVADNGSSDDTAEEARRHGARVVDAPRRGYGSACQAAIAAMRAAGPPDLVVFLDADASEDPAELPAVLEPLAGCRADLVIGVRRHAQLPAHVAAGNRLACRILEALAGHRFSDLGPFRAIRFEALDRLALRDPDYGWNVEMQARAVGAGLRIVEVSVSHRPRRVGRSKISGSVRGTVDAGAKILWTAVREGWRARRDSAHRVA